MSAADIELLWSSTKLRSIARCAQRTRSASDTLEIGASVGRDVARTSQRFDFAFHEHIALFLHFDLPSATHDGAEVGDDVGSPPGTNSIGAAVGFAQSSRDVAKVLSG